MPKLEPREKRDNDTNCFHNYRNVRMTTRRSRMDVCLVLRLFASNIPNHQENMSVKCIPLHPHFYIEIWGLQGFT